MLYLYFFRKEIVLEMLIYTSLVFVLIDRCNALEKNNLINLLILRY